MSPRKRRSSLAGVFAAATALLSLVPLSFAACGHTASDLPSPGGDSGSVDGAVVTGDGGSPDGAMCQGLECQRKPCPGGGKTTLSGFVYSPAGDVPLYNVVVYVPNAPLLPLSTGASCERCGAPPSGSPIAITLTDATGHFVLENVPAGANIPLVMKIGKWRRQVKIPSVASCVDTPLTDRSMMRLPRNHDEGDMPLIAITTGAADTAECLPRKIGIDDAEFTTANGGGRVHLYAGGAAGAGSTSQFAPDAGDGGSFPPALSLWSDVNRLLDYDLVLMGCEGRPGAPAEKPPAALQAVFDYVSRGGRVFAWHYHSDWFAKGPPPFPQIGDWTTVGMNPPDPNIGIVDPSFPKGAALRDWLTAVDASAAPGQFTIDGARKNLTTIDTTKARTWVSLLTPDGGTDAIEHISFNTPLTVPDNQRCGRVAYSDLHTGLNPGGPPFPGECNSGPMSPQEKALAFLFFDLGACIQADSEKPAPPPLK